ncbi:MAG: T9SS type A sorting domain-containing protein [Bacteroidetes bacterium]|nr:T9SS type A sorting domain-containing protein [Bacteroidota bacterium]MBU1117034.1 T9SS type A sorting domain-containing protein [Bacteroidota bacterium]MBU1797629.1 T9SS type A sorting domain-containing protein [Bacteroidota bacterium]
MVNKYKNIILISLFSFTLIPAQEWQSNIVYFGNDGKLNYERDNQGNSIPDFSYVGYKNRNDSIPFIPVVKTISPVVGDNTDNINNAIFEMALNNPIQENGFRGTLLLEKGLYEVYGTIKINASGIVIRGEGEGENPDSNTVIYGRGNSPSSRTIIVAGGGTSTKWSDQVSGTKTNIMSDTVFVGENTFEVANASAYSVGDNIIIYHPCTATWLEAIDYGGTMSGEPGAEAADVPWAVGSQPIVFNRYITKIEGNIITIDAPLFNTLIQSLSQSYIYKYGRGALRTNIGIENLRVDIETHNLTNDESHAYNAIDLFLIEDAWIRNVTTLHFYEAGFRTNTATRITIENCSALEPVSQITGGRRYNFETYTASQQILFQNNRATSARHAYMSNGMSWTSGIVFYNCTSEGAYASSEGHRRWSQGLLYDNHRELDNVRPGYNIRRIGLYNRAYYGTSHGWSSVNSITWNCDVKDGEILIQQPPIGQNYSIGSFASLIAGYGDDSFDAPIGHTEGTNKIGLNPSSLYLAQYNERMDTQVSVHEEKSSINIPLEFTILPNYPNPFNPTTTLGYSLPQTEKVIVKVYDVTGRTIKNLFNGIQEAGINYTQWNGDNDFNHQVGSGVYFYTIQAKHGLLTGKMILVK